MRKLRQKLSHPQDPTRPIADFKEYLSKNINILQKSRTFEESRAWQLFFEIISFSIYYWISKKSGGGLFFKLPPINKQLQLTKSAKKSLV